MYVFCWAWEGVVEGFGVFVKIVMLRVGRGGT